MDEQYFECSIICKTILQLDNKFNIIFGIEFGFCWPTSLGELQLSQESDAQISEFPVTFKFSTYKVMDIT